MCNLKALGIISSGSSLLANIIISEAFDHVSLFWHNFSDFLVYKERGTKCKIYKDSLISNPNSIHVS